MKKELILIAVLASFLSLGCAIGIPETNDNNLIVGNSKKALQMDSGMPMDMTSPAPPTMPDTTTTTPDIAPPTMPDTTTTTPDIAPPTMPDTTTTTPDYPTLIDGANIHPDLNSQGKLIYIVCFYGENDHDDLAKNMCDYAFTNCKATYGNSCKKVVNPSQSKLDGLNADATATVYVVTHSTPNTSSPDPTPTTDPSGIDIWDSNLCPGDISSQFPGTPIIWFGCYGYNIQQCYNNVTSPQTVSECLNSADKKIQCMMTALTACMVEAANAGKTFTNTELQQCALQKAPTQTGCGNLVFTPPAAPATP